MCSALHCFCFLCNERLFVCVFVQVVPVPPSQVPVATSHSSDKTEVCSEFVFAQDISVAECVDSHVEDGVCAGSDFQNNNPVSFYLLPNIIFICAIGFLPFDVKRQVDVHPFFYRI